MMSLLLLLNIVFILTDLWNVYDECENFAVLKGHTGAIMELHFNIDGRYSMHYKYVILTHTIV